MLSVENIFYQPKDKEKEVNKKRKKFVNYSSDHLTLLNIFNFYCELVKKKGKKEGNTFAKDHYINEKSLAKAVLIHA
jgi:HrpA-like RNA helicase